MCVYVCVRLEVLNDLERPTENLNIFDGLVKDDETRGYHFVMQRIIFQITRLRLRYLCLSIES